MSGSMPSGSINSLLRAEIEPEELVGCTKFREFECGGAGTRNELCRIVVPLQDGTVRLWDSASGHLIADSIRHPGSTFACFSPDSRRVAVSATDGTVLVRTVPEWPGNEVGWLITLAEQVARQRFLPPDRFDPMAPESQTLLNPARPASRKDTLRESMQQWLRSPAHR